MAAGPQCTSGPNKVVFAANWPDLSRFAPNCPDFLGDLSHGKCIEHPKSECYDFEADIILLYPGSDGKLHIVLIEVKRSRNLQKKPILKAFSQLLKDTNFVLKLLSDIPTDCLDISVFAAFPESEDDLVDEMAFPEAEDDLVAKTAFFSRILIRKLEIQKLFFSIFKKLRKLHKCNKSSE